jgi:hypothetical protein
MTSQESDPLFTKVPEPDSSRVLTAWAWLLRTNYGLIGRSIFGDLFLADTSGHVHMVDIVAGELKEIATCIEEFEWEVTEGEGKEQWLLASLARQAINSGLSPGPGHCLAFRTPPLLGGQLVVGNLVVWELFAYYDGLSKILPQVLALPLGTEVRVKPSQDDG